MFGGGEVSGMRYLKLTIAYDGTHYVGWQFQANGLSIQACLEKAWHTITNESLRITASGRTDAGVHARGQVCGLQTESQLSCRELHRGLNAVLPDDIKVLEVHVAPEGFRAINDAIRKTYHYELQSGFIPDVFARDYSWYIPLGLDVASMREAATILVGRLDFASFQSAGSTRLSTVRTVERLELRERWQNPYQYVTVEITADGFLYNMVRAITGTLVRVGQGKETVEWVRHVLNARDRKVAGPTAPPQGLYLWQVDYPPNCQNPENQLNLS